MPILLTHAWVGLYIRPIWIFTTNFCGALQRYYLRELPITLEELEWLICVASQFFSVPTLSFSEYDDKCLRLHPLCTASGGHYFKWLCDCKLCLQKTSFYMLANTSCVAPFTTSFCNYYSETKTNDTFPPKNTVFCCIIDGNKLRINLQTYVKLSIYLKHVSNGTLAHSLPASKLWYISNLTSPSLPGGPSKEHFKKYHKIFETLSVLLLSPNLIICIKTAKRF